MNSVKLRLSITPVNGHKVWPYFAQHHYLTAKYSGHKAWVATLEDGTLVGFVSIISFPNGYLKDAWREHRTVVTPDFQGLGVGPRLSDWAGEYVRNVMGGRFFSRTSHPRMGAYRESSDLWRPTTKNRKSRSKNELAGGAASGKLRWLSDTRLTYAHEYMGKEGNL